MRIHIVPTGYEHDRIINPVLKRRADKVYLLVHNNPTQDDAKRYIDKVRESLERENIEFEERAHDRLDVFDVIKTVKEIIQEERGNHIYFNLAPGSKIQAIGGMMACMMFNDDGSRNITPYYVEAKSYNTPRSRQIAIGVRRIIDIPAYEIQKPSERLIKALGIIKDAGDRIKKKDMSKACEENKIIAVESANRSQALFSSLEKNVIRPLRDTWKFIEEEKIGRNRWIKITERGDDAARFLLPADGR